ncbi:putative secreted protein [Corynebacterium renale]|nr:putative secreted protein [Corynebacterium renale]STD00617.1 putative secreted protein [Corynebacterium renale]
MSTLFCRLAVDILTRADTFRRCCPKVVFMHTSLPKRTLLAGLAAATLAGCAAPEDPAPEPAPTTHAAPAVPLTETPAHDRTAAEPCPYLDTQRVADTNGQRVTGSNVDTRFEVPACVFWSYPEEPQLEVIVRRLGSVADAGAVVDHFVPVAESERAELPGGWTGGRMGATGTGAAYAVAREGDAVVVRTNQEQSFKAEQVAEEVIRTVFG